MFCTFIKCFLHSNYLIMLYEYIRGRQLRTFAQGGEGGVKSERWGRRCQKRTGKGGFTKIVKLKRIY